MTEKNQRRLNGEIACPWVTRPKFVNRSMFHQLIYRFNTIPVKILAYFFFGRNRQADSKSHMEMQRALYCQNNSEKEQSWRTNVILRLM